MAGRSALLRSQGQETMRHLIWITASLVILTVQSGQINVSRAAANAITETLFALPLDAGNILEGATTLPPRTFSCGTNVCDANSSYCEMIKTDVAKIPNVYGCKPLPKACIPDSTNGLPSCDCFPKLTRCAFCSKLVRDGVQYFQRTCIGGGAGNWH